MKLKYEAQITIRWNAGEPDWYIGHSFGDWRIGLGWLRINAMFWKKRQ